MSTDREMNAALKLVGRMLADPDMRPDYEPMIDGPRIVTVVSTHSTIGALSRLEALADHHEWAAVACVDIEQRTIVPLIVKLEGMTQTLAQLRAAGDVPMATFVAAMEGPLEGRKFPGLRRSETYLVTA